MLKEFRSLEVFAAFSRWSLDISFFRCLVEMGTTRLSSKLLNS